MTHKKDAAAINERLTKAMSERDVWKASGIQEKYLEAYSLVEALELLLEKHERQVRESKVEDTRMLPGSENALVDPKMRISEEVLSDDEEVLSDDVAQRARVMSQFSIGFNGRYYHYRGYRYELLFDAVNYARLQQSRARGSASDHFDSADEEQKPPLEEVMPPGEANLRLMNSLAITFHNGTYLFGPYRYDRLADAALYARQQPTS